LARAASSAGRTQAAISSKSSATSYFLPGRENAEGAVTLGFTPQNAFVLNACRPLSDLVAWRDGWDHVAFVPRVQLVATLALLLLGASCGEIAESVTGQR
jgi:hypothetical protein